MRRTPNETRGYPLGAPKQLVISSEFRNKKFQHLIPVAHGVTTHQVGHYLKRPQGTKDVAQTDGPPATPSEAPEVSKARRKEALKDLSDQRHKSGTTGKRKTIVMIYITL